jgi:hypothetical protein
MGRGGKMSRQRLLHKSVNSYVARGLTAFRSGDSAHSAHGDIFDCEENLSVAEPFGLMNLNLQDSRRLVTGVL